MRPHLVLTVFLHDRFHGMGEGSPEWPPSPARLFQALVAGSAIGGKLPPQMEGALEWLEQQPAPVIATPWASLGRPVALFVPNNDADSLADPRDVSTIRTKKLVHPRLPERGPLLYAWAITDSDRAIAQRIVEAANDVYQLGRGIDMAWASGEVVNDLALQERLRAFDGAVHIPDQKGNERVLPCPAPGSLCSLVRRHSAQRLRVEGAGKNARTYFVNAPKPFFVGVGYAPVVRRLLFDLRNLAAPDQVFVERAGEVASFVEQVRDAAAERLRAALPEHVAAIERTLVGRKADGRDDGSIAARVRIVPLPSIGHEHADRGVRRVLVEIPSAAPLRPKDIEWAFSGLVLRASAARQLEQSMLLVPAGERTMLDHYERASRVWRSVTAVALPDRARGRQIAPTIRREERKSAVERLAEEDAAVGAVCTALRHAGVCAAPLSVRVQREPFDIKGLRAEVFGRPPRFPKERLWHVEIAFPRAIEGPLVLGDGRFLGLGVMAPAAAATDVHAFRILAGSAQNVDPEGVARALRRAVMSRVQDRRPGRELDRFFTGHEGDGSPARTESSSHLAYHFDPHRLRLLLFAPHRLDRRDPTGHERSQLEQLAAALDGLHMLRAGAAGLLSLVREEVPDDDLLLGASRCWTSLPPYLVTRHARATTPEAVLREDVERECTRRGLPAPSVEVVRCQGVARRGLTGQVRLTFATAVRGPVVLGRTRYLGGGLFIAET